jgi:uncharacterized protein (DUF1778 family)
MLWLQCSYNYATVWSMAKSPVRRSTKDDVVRMRVTPAEKQALTAAAEREGLGLSAWLRQLALRAAGALPSRK